MTDQRYLDQPELHAKATYRSALLTYPGNLRAALKDAQEDPRKTLFGVAQGMASVFVTKVLASTQPDFIWMDAEHAMFDRSSLYDAIQAAQHHSEGKSMVVVRIPKHDETVLSTALDAGAAGIVIPHCDNAAEIKHLLNEIYYPPMGQRSFSPWTFTPGISDKSLYKGDPFNMGTSNKHIVVIAQIESVEGVKNIDEIAALEGVSALMFGPGDFMADAGLELKLGGEPHPTFAAAMGAFAEAGKKYGKPLFGAAMSMDMVPMMIQQGYRAIAVAFDMWGLSNLVHGSIAKGREYAQAAGATNGVAVPNGKAPPS
ncbi:Pyruvate/Phosphoenolpyruvate kinase-like domain-containing protein [Leptodontidium sp. 2 PMI_412]|nr:Pyruvate/Phosphoenolpyruvate kinase-like domain-containing protein [Leptodontidium sp. MPI-SDFR-AT-0119]KAH9207449.1 Pyruvate/Phosphoenolpyruvate kinase-like domain-containing protein [Leptodontidium sp. 2 PMI_412]